MAFAQLKDYNLTFPTFKYPDLSNVFSQVAAAYRDDQVGKNIGAGITSAGKSIAGGITDATDNYQKAQVAKQNALIASAPVAQAVVAPTPQIVSPSTNTGGTLSGLTPDLPSNNQTTSPLSGTTDVTPTTFADDNMATVHQFEQESPQDPALAAPLATTHVSNPGPLDVTLPDDLQNLEVQPVGETSPNPLQTPAQRAATRGLPLDQGELPTGAGSAPISPLLNPTLIAGNGPLVGLGADPNAIQGARKIVKAPDGSVAGWYNMRGSVPISYFDAATHATSNLSKQELSAFQNPNGLPQKQTAAQINANIGQHFPNKAAAEAAYGAGAADGATVHEDGSITLKKLPTTKPDIKALADGVENGTINPNLPGMSRGGINSAVTAELAARGVDLRSKQLDQTATQSFMKGLNSQQQIAKRQNIEMADHSLDVLQDLGKQWKGGGFPLLNKANITLAKNGAYGPEAASIATRLDAQTSEVSSLLGSIYMGGGSPTDHALKLAETNLRSDYSEKVLNDSIDLARQNIANRKASMGAVTPAGVQAPAATPQAATAPANAKTGASKPVINSQAEYDALPKGTPYVDSFGKPAVKN